MRKLLFLIPVILFATHLKAQKLTKHAIDYGFKAGLNHSMVRGYETNGAKTGFTGDELYTGFFADLKLNAEAILEGELLFSWTDEYHFIEIPAHLKYKLANRWSIFAGPKLDIILEDGNHPDETGY